MVLLDLGAGLAPEWLPLAVMVILFVALGLLWFSMRGHLKKADYPDPPDADLRRPRTNGEH